jgi:hypothetical protein
VKTQKTHNLLAISTAEIDRMHNTNVRGVIRGLDEQGGVRRTFASFDELGW